MKDKTDNELEDLEPIAEIVIKKYATNGPPVTLSEILDRISKNLEDLEPID